MVAYQFPPRGGPGVQRITRFVQHLPEFGFEPVVLTVEPEEYKKAGETVDHSLVEKIPPITKVVRTPSYQPFKLVAFLTRLRLFRLVWVFAYPFFWERTARWPFGVYPRASKLVNDENIKIVFTTSGPFSSLQLGLKLKKNNGLRWVADLRDPFTDAYAWKFPTKLHWYITRWFEKKILSQADMLIVNTEEVRKLYISRGISSPEKIKVITNGF